MTEMQPSGAGNSLAPGAEKYPHLDALEEEARAKREPLRYGETMAEFQRGGDMDPGEIWAVLSNELLFPAEIAGIPVSPYESGPILRECLKRAGASNSRLAMHERATRMEERMHVLRDRKDTQETITEEGKKKAEEIERQMAVTARRLYGKEVQTSEGTILRTEPGLIGRLERKNQEEGLPEDKAEWEKLYWKLRGSMTLLDVFSQREKALSSYDQYCENLFLSGFYKHELMMSEVSALLEDEMYGPEIEEAAKAIVAVHLGEGVKVKLGEFGPVFDEVLNRYMTAKNIKPGEPVLLPKPLQVNTNGDILGREVVNAYAFEKAARKIDPTNPRYFAAERAVLLAERFLEVTLLTTWLCTERDLKGIPVGKKLGMARLEGSGSSDMDKIVLSRLKWQNERAANKPAGPPDWDWSNMPFEGFAPDFFHRKVGNVKYINDKGEEVFPRGTSATEEVTLFDLWFSGIGQDKKAFALSEIFRGINDQSARFGIVTKEGSTAVTRRIMVSAFPENAFDSWHFVMYKQSKALGYVLNNSRGGKDDCIEELTLPEKFRQFNKDLSTAIGGLDLPKAEKEIALNWLKLNIVLARVGAWMESLTREGTDLPLTVKEVQKQPATERPRSTAGVFNGDVLKIIGSARLASYLPETILNWLGRNTYRKFLTYTDFKKTF